MRFDDRLLTVLSQPVGTPHDKAVRWRQLVDLVARSGPQDDSPALARALDEIRAGAAEVDEPLRAAAARAIAALPIPFGLLEIFALDTLAVSAPVLAAARIDEAGWRTLAERVAPDTRRFLEAINPGMAGPSPAPFTEMLVEDEPAKPPRPAAARPPGRSLADVVARIERRRRQRDRAGGGGELARGPPAPALFRWECGPSGEIRWVEGAPRGALIGRSVATPRAAVGEGPDTEIVRAFALRSPFRDASFTIAGEGTLAGEWVMSGVPAFEPADGRFAGYRGIAQRRGAGGGEEELAIPALGDPASLRELVHEIKTPLNAIIGFAEIIDGQYLGPADRPYRQRAAHIVGQARILLEAIDDLDFAAKSRSAPAGTHAALTAVVERVVASIGEGAIGLSLPPGAAEAAIGAEVAERIIRRTFAAVLAASEAREQLRVSIERSGQRWRVAISRPRGLQGLSDEQLFEGGEGEAELQLDFRLARSLARIAGIALVAGERDISLLFERAST